MEPRHTAAALDEQETSIESVYSHAEEGVSSRMLLAKLRDPGCRPSASGADAASEGRVGPRPETGRLVRPAGLPTRSSPRQLGSRLANSSRNQSLTTSSHSRDS